MSLMLKQTYVLGIVEVVRVMALLISLVSQALAWPSGKKATVRLPSLQMEMLATGRFPRSIVPSTVWQ